MKRKLYIAGPVTGMPDNNIDMFIEAQKAAESIGYIVLSTHLLPKGMSEAFYMKSGFIMIDECDRMMMLPGWEDSLGAKAEFNYAQKVGVTEIFGFTSLDVNPSHAGHHSL